jgi:hypothetical protein
MKSLFRKKAKGKSDDPVKAVVRRQHYKHLCGIFCGLQTQTESCFVELLEVVDEISSLFVGAHLRSYGAAVISSRVLRHRCFRV